MIRIALCDDDNTCIVQLERVLEQVARQRGIKVEISVFYDGSTLVDYIEREKQHFDLIYLDIEMKKMDGLSAALRIREQDEFVYLIYVTSHKNYAIEAYEVQPFLFIVKPVDEKIIEKSFVKIYDKITSGDVFYEFKVKGTYHKIIVNDIMYFQSDKRRIRIYMKDGTMYDYYDKLDRIEAYMNKCKLDFWRVHRSVYVNARYIREKAYDHILLSSGEYISISENRRRSINMHYVKMVERDML